MHKKSISAGARDWQADGLLRAGSSRAQRRGNNCLTQDAVGSGGQQAVECHLGEGGEGSGIEWSCICQCLKPLHHRLWQLHFVQKGCAQSRGLRSADHEAGPAWCFNIYCTFHRALSAPNLARRWAEELEQEPNKAHHTASVSRGWRLQLQFLNTVEGLLTI